MTGRVTAGPQDSDTGCSIADISTTGVAPPPPTQVALTGTVDFSDDSSTVALRFTGGPGTFTLPLSGELTTPGPPGFVEIIGYGSSEWAAGQSSPTSSGTLTLSRTSTGTTGTIHGSVDAWLAPLRATNALSSHPGHVELFGTLGAREPMGRFELPTNRLQGGCSTPELHRLGTRILPWELVPHCSDRGLCGTLSLGTKMAKGSTLTSTAGNHLLEALPDTERETLMRQLRPAHLTVKTVLFDPGQPIQFVHFPVDGVISLVTPLADGNIVEVATIGNEGIVGVPLVPGGSLAVRAISQVGGRTLRLEAGEFFRAVERLPAFRELVQKYVQALFGQISQAAACNRLHSNEERLSRWLLMSHDRVGTDTFPITHEFLGQMLGSRRATVTLSAGLLQSAGLIRYHRGRVTIVDREGLESVSCECYGIIKAALDRVVSSTN